MYRQQRNYENLNKAIFDGVGEFGIPEIRPVHDVDVAHWISFNYAKGCEESEEHGVHFFIDDYQFMRTWTNPDTYMKMMRKFKAVLTPDFSTYTDFPKAVQIWNHYRKHWIGAYWQATGELHVVFRRGAGWRHCGGEYGRHTDQSVCDKVFHPGIPRDDEAAETGKGDRVRLIRAERVRGRYHPGSAVSAKVESQER